MTSHVHRDLIIAWANGAIIEASIEIPAFIDDQWVFLENWVKCPTPLWNDVTKYRIAQ